MAMHVNKIHDVDLLWHPIASRMSFVHVNMLTVDEHKYSPPSILRYIFHIKPNFSKILL